MDAAMLTLGVLAVAALLFATEIIPLAVTAMGAAIALGLLGVLTPAQVFSGLSNSTVVLGDVPNGARTENRHRRRQEVGQ